MKNPAAVRVSRATPGNGVGMLSKGRMGPMSGAESRAATERGSTGGNLPGFMIARMAEEAWSRTLKGSDVPRRAATPKNVCPDCRMARASSTGACFC